MIKQSEITVVFVRGGSRKEIFGGLAPHHFGGNNKVSAQSLTRKPCCRKDNRAMRPMYV